MTGTLYRERKLALMLRTSAGHTPGNNFPLLRRELDKTLLIFVVNVHVPALAEPADFSFPYFFYRYQFIYSLIL